MNEIKPINLCICGISKTLPLAFDESITMVELLYAIKEKLNETINQTNTLTDDMQNLYDYVNNYFESLDVQEEIKNGLDEMAEDGTLTELIGNYVNPLFDNLSDSISDEMNGFENSINNEMSEFKTSVNTSIDEISALVGSLNDGSPLVASDVSEMTETDRVYVNTTDGKWYYYDGDSWEIGGTYQSTGIEDGSVTCKKTNFMEQINLIPESNWVTDKILSYSNGVNETSISGSSYSSEYVPIKDTATKMVVIGDLGGACHIYYYGSDFTFISQASVSDNNFNAIPDNSKYFRIGFATTYGPANYKILFYEDLINGLNIYNDGTLKDNFINFDSKKILYNTKKLNLIPKGYGITATPTINGNVASYSWTDTTNSTHYIGFGINWDMKVNDKLKLEFTGNYPFSRVSLYNSTASGLITSGGSDLNTTSYLSDGKCEFTINSTLLANINNKTVFIIMTIPASSESTAYSYTVKVQINNDFYYFDDLVKNFNPSEKTYKAIFLGDSITKLGGNDGWVYKFCNLLNITEYENVAVSGAHLKDYSDSVYDGDPVHGGPDNDHNNVLGNQVQKIINNQATYVTPDFIFIAIGTNDGINATTEQAYNEYYESDGTVKPIADANRQTSSGAFRYANYKLHDLYPNAQIIWCTPIQAVNTIKNVKNTISYGDSLKLLCAFDSKYCLDSEKCGINGSNEVAGSNGEYLVDGLHLNSAGATLLATFNANEVRKFFN